LKVNLKVAALLPILYEINNCCILWKGDKMLVLKAIHRLNIYWVLAGARVGGVNFGTNLRVSLRNQCILLSVVFFVALHVTYT